MNRIAHYLIGATLLLSASGPLLAQDKGAEKPAPKKIILPPFGVASKAPAIFMVLDMEIDTKDFQLPMKLSEFIGLCYDKVAAQGAELPILIDSGAFPAANKDKIDVKDATIKLPPFPKRMSVGQALQLALSQVSDAKATILIRKGTILITTKTKASVKSLLQEQILTSFHQKPLGEAIFVLSDMTGASIVLDPRAGEKLLTPVNATFTNDATLESVLLVLTDLADLKTVVVGETIYVTTPENAKTVSTSLTK
jgi:hypothetical protein